MKKLVKMFKSASPAAKASMALLFANFILKGLSLISGPVFTRIMSTEQYGIVSTFTSWQSLLIVIVTLNLSQGVFNNGMLDFKNNRDEFQFSLLFISTISALIWFIIYGIFSTFFQKMFEMPTVLIYIMFLYFLFVPAYQFWSGRQRYEFKYKALTLISIFSSLMALILGVFAVLIADNSKDAIARVCVMEGINIVIGIFFFCKIGIKAHFKPNLQYCRYALKFNLPLLPHYLSMYVLSSADRIMITKMINASATAIYSVAYTVASVINIFWQSIEASLSPWIYEKLDKNEYLPVKKLTLQVILFFAVLCITCTLFAPEIMMILAPKSYYSGIYVIPSVAVGVFFTAMYSLYMRIELFYKQTGFATIATTIAAISNIILNYIFIDIFGFVAAGYTTMVCYAMLSLFHYMNIRKKGYAYIFNNRMFLLISFGVIVLSIIITFLYDYAILRYLSILIVLIGLFLKRKSIINILKKRQG